jgi:hypothetical protein
MAAAVAAVLIVTDGMHRMKPTAYLLAGTILVAVIGPAQAGDLAYGRAQPRVIYAPPPVVYAALPVVVAQPVVVAEPVVPRLVVDQGPYYSGPNLVDFPNPIFHEDRPVRPYPYVRTWEAQQAYAAEQIYRQPPRVPRYYRAPISRLN